MYRISVHIFIFCLSFLIGTSCSSDYDVNEPLQQATQIVDTDPQTALALLTKINHPQLLNEDEYMHYVVALVQSKYMDHQDITTDSLILDAQRYFTETNNPEMIARSSFYSAAYWHKKNVEEKSLEYSLLAYYYSGVAKNNLFCAKSAFWIGVIYYDQEQLNDALIYFHQALNLYSQLPEADSERLNLMFMLGQTYYELKQPDQALEQYEKGLETARSVKNTPYEILFLHNKGIHYRENQEYPIAQEYFDQALSKEPDTETTLRVYLSYARLYRMQNNTDSTFYYLDLVKKQISEITYPYTHREIYSELMLYYGKEGNTQELKRYSQLVARENQIIHEMQSEEKIYFVNRLFKQFKHFQLFKQQAEKKYGLTLEVAIMVTIALFILVMVFRKKSKTNNEKFKHIHVKQLSQKLDYQHFLMLGTRLITRSIDNLFYKNKNLNDTLIRKQFLILRASFQIEMANQISSAIHQLRNGAQAVLKLSTEDLCIIYLLRLQNTDKEISRMLGYEDLPENHITLRRLKIQEILTEAGLTNRDIQILLLG